MNGKFVSWCRKGGSFTRSDGKKFDYDNLILYVIEKGQVYSRDDGSYCNGKPVVMHEVKVPVSKWVDVANADIKILDELLNHDISVFYDLVSYSGQPSVRLASVEFH